MGTALVAKSSALKNFSHEALGSACSHLIYMSLQLLLVSAGLSILIISSWSGLKSRNMPISFQYEAYLGVTYLHKSFSSGLVDSAHNTTFYNYCIDTIAIATRESCKSCNDRS